MTLFVVSLSLPASLLRRARLRVELPKADENLIAHDCLRGTQNLNLPIQYNLSRCKSIGRMKGTVGWDQCPVR